MKTLKKNLLPILVLGLFLFQNSTLQASCTYAKSFSGEEMDVGIMLSWTTSSEEENARFVIEKAEDGGEFAPIGSVTGAGNSKELKSYDFFDIDIRGQYLLYRLRQIDHDGTSSYSKTLFITMSTANQFMVAQMSEVIATDVFEVSIDALVDSHLEYTLTDWKGNIVLQEGLNVVAGLNDIMIELDNKDEGIYKLVLRVEEEVEELTFRKVFDPNKPKVVTAKKN